MIERKVENVDEDSLERCQATFKGGQCRYKRSINSQYCPMHRGDAGNKQLEEKSKRMYRLAKYQVRMGEFADDEKVKGLREEIGILRVVLEETILQIKTPGEMLLYSSKIADTVVKIEKLVSSCHRIEASAGMLLDKSAAIQLAVTIVEIIGRYIPDADIIGNISNEIVDTISKIKSEQTL